MIDINYIKAFFPQHIAQNANFQKHMVKEYIQLMTLDFLSATPYIQKTAFIGGTNLRLLKGIDRFSEDLDFDCKDMSNEDFMAMTDGVVAFLHRSGLNAEVRDKNNSRLVAYRRSIYFPEFLFELGLTGHKDERFLMKIEAQDQGVDYAIDVKQVKGCGFYFMLPTPPDEVLLSMKLSALLSRCKGRDIYDTMFLMQQTKPSLEFLKAKNGICDIDELKKALIEKLNTVDLNDKKRDFEHLLFNKQASERILHFAEFIKSL